MRVIPKPPRFTWKDATAQKKESQKRTCIDTPDIGWLFNKENELAKRYMLANPAQGTRITKCVEGLHNKAFILKMDNGSEVFAKLPNPNAGPAHFSVASEVATRELLRDVFDIPSPRVLSWSSDATNNSVEAEYIIEEKTPGLRLGSLWNKWPRELKLQLINQVVDMENELANVGFDKQGCIYFKEDLRSLVGEAEDIHAHNVDCNVFDRFSVRPLTTNELWSGTSMSMKLDRGPWKDAPEYTRAIGQNEMAWIKAHTVPRMNFSSRTRTESFLKMVLPI